MLKGFRLLALAMALMVGFSGCHILRGRRVQATPPPPFSSPIEQPVGRPGMSVQDILTVMSERRTDLRSLLGSLTLTVGAARSNSRQQFDANMYSAPPSFLRVQGSADTGTLFDFLLDEQRVQVLVNPEQTMYEGTLDRLRSNQKLMAGIQPDDLVNSFFIEQNLYRTLTQAPPAAFKEEKDHYLITIAYPTGVSERYHLRMQDLLVDRVERLAGRRNIGNVRFDSYRFLGNDKHLVPARFEAALPSGAVATVEVNSLEPNAKREKALTVLEMPSDFRKVPL